MRFICSVLVAVLAASVAAPVQASWWDRVFGPTIQPDSQPKSSDSVSPSDGASAPSQVLVIPEAAVAAQPGFSLASDYKLGPGDRLKIAVFNEEGLTVDVRLSDAGTLSFPLLGEIRAQGMTIGMLQDKLTDMLKAGYLVNPQVYVSILEYRQFFVNGEVKSPGGIAFMPGLTVRKAIALAGGFTPRASFTKLFVIHEDDPFGRPSPVTLDSFLRPGDILTVEQSFF